jgi:transketolase
MQTVAEQPHDLVALEGLARQIRRDSIRMIAGTGSGHPGGALGAAELIAALYGAVLRHDPRRPDDPDRDRFVLSNGHICAAFYSALCRTGYLEPAELATFRKLDSRLQGHPARVDLPDLVETSSGPLGQGLSVANGLALAARLDGRNSRMYCLVGDGELQEGQIWEALMAAAHHRLGNLTLLISDNGLQIDGEVEHVKRIAPLPDKLRAFGWRVDEIDGHDLQAILEVLAGASGAAAAGRPHAVIAHTVMGKGVPFMENLAKWHGTVPSLDEARRALEAIGPSDGYLDFPLQEVEL